MPKAPRVPTVLEGLLEPEEVRSNLKCYGRMVLVKPEPIKSSYDGALVLPELNSQWQEHRWGKIVSVGTSCRNPYRVGQNVLCLKYAGAKFKYNNEEYVSYLESELDMTWTAES